MIVRSSSHTLRFANTGKREGVFKLLAEWRRVMQLICDDMWLNGYTWVEDDVFHEFNPAKFKYTLPKYLDYNRFEIDTWLSARMMSSLVNQLSGKLRAICTKNAKRIEVFDKEASKGKYLERLWEVIEQRRPSKPDLSDAGIEISSKCAELNLTPDGEYDIVGVDLGIKDLAITSCGEVIANPAAYRKQMQRLRRYQRSVSRKKKGSKNRKKAVARLAKLHQRIANIRKDSAHQCTTSLTRKLAPKVMVIETLNPKNMARNRKLAGSIMDANFGRIHVQLEYKCKWNNIQLIKAPSFYPSSQICSECGCFQKKDLKLTDREWTCPHCGCHHDRDVNAARNLRFYGLWLYGFVQSTTTARYAANACPDGKCRREGNGSEPYPRDLRLQFFETQEQCKSLKQELNSMNSLT